MWSSELQSPHHPMLQGVYLIFFLGLNCHLQHTPSHNQQVYPHQTDQSTQICFSECSQCLQGNLLSRAQQLKHMIDIMCHCSKPGYCDRTSSSYNSLPVGEDEHSICSHKNSEQNIVNYPNIAAMDIRFWSGGIWSQIFAAQSECRAHVSKFKKCTVILVIPTCCSHR
jgi:hypothetical protein